MPVDAAMIFAAGFGTRMRDLTRDRPKPMLEVGGLPLIDHALRQVTDAGIGRVVVNTHYKAEVIAKHLAGRPGITVLHEDPILETGGGLKAALPTLGDGPVVTMNPDALFIGPNPVRAVLDRRDVTAGATLLLVPRARTLEHAGPGDFDVAGGVPVRRSGDVAEFVYSGVQVVDPSDLSSIKDRCFSLNVLWDRLFAEGAVRACVYDGDWIDVGTPEGLAQANRAVADV